MFGIKRVHDFKQHFAQNTTHPTSVYLKLLGCAPFFHRSNRAVETARELDHEIANLSCYFSIFDHWHPAASMHRLTQFQNRKP